MMPINLTSQFATLGPILLHKIMLFWWNLHYRIKVNPKPNLISSISSFSFYLSSFVEFHSSFVSDGESFYFFYLGYGHEKNTRITKILCLLCPSMVVWLLGFNFKKEEKMRKKMIPRKNKMKAYEGLNP